MPSTEQTRLRAEILIVLTVTFGTSGIRAVLRLLDALASPAPLNQQSVTLNSAESSVSWLDLALQVASAASLFGWGALALYLLGARLPRPGTTDWVQGAGLALLIGIPGLALYVTALHAGWTKEVVVATDTAQLPTLLLWSAANAFGEEVVVVLWLTRRLSQLGWSRNASIVASAVLRGTYHLYQGISAGIGNVAMGILFGWAFHKTGRIWPLILAHFLIDATAYLGYQLLDLSWLGL
ncbi:CAAX amino terminal protease self- immunity [Corynebacterium capitovis DSM 44611]|uniref:CPBP family intramembrane glutamic endopeptidase n=1 Tax=Corynebacterium capitovis TaxID=131081 RepID=UPI00036FFE68|nr:CPBP family intramembrane glutamic endopeptidase [Corynebacterium capitovis]WKD58302.1 CAAX amino terminal protease self- immunity [Corynebacterium capitovis DSM 44611]